MTYDTILLDRSLFSKSTNKLDQNKNIYFLVGTRFYYNADYRYWANQAVPDIALSYYYVFEPLFEEVMNDDNVSDEVKTNILFNLVELQQLLTL